MTPFARILRTAVDRTPGALGGAFAAYDGEMVDYITEVDPTELAIMTAHYGVVLASLEAALNTKHFGGAEYFVVENSKVDVVVHTVDASVSPMSMPYTLLGNSFLTRFSMRRDNDVMRLELRR